LGRKKIWKKKYFLKNAGVLLIAVVMVLSTVIVTGNKVNTSAVGASVSDDVITWHVSSSTVFNDPPNKPSLTGPTQGDVGVEYTFSTSAVDPDGDNVYFYWDWADGTNSGWLGPYNSGQSASAKHTWSEAGTYCIKVKAKDINGAESVWSDPLCVTIGGGENNPPNRPSKPSGPVTGEPGVEYTYTTSTTDPDNDKVKYGWEWTQDNTVDGWTNLYNSGATCSVKLTFDEVGTYYLRVLAEDEHGAQSGFSSSLAVVISEECIDFKDFNSCPIGDNTKLTVEGNNMVISDMEDGDGFTTTIPTSNDVYQCDIKDALGSPSVSFSGKISGSFNNSAFWMRMTVGSNPSLDSSFGVYPAGFQGTASGAPSIIAWVKSDDCEGNWEIAFRKTCEPTDTLDIGYIEFPPTLGVYPVGFSGTASGAPSIIMYAGDACDCDALWTWSEEGIEKLDINALMVTYVTTCETCGKQYPLLCTCEPTDHAGSLSEFSLSVTGMSEIRVSDMWAKHNVIPSPGDINGPSSGKTGETYTFSIAPGDSDDVYLVGMWNFGQGDDPQYDGVYPAGFQGTASGAPSIINWTSNDKGNFVVKVRAFDMNMGVSQWETHEISIPKNKVNSRPLFLEFLQNFFETHPNAFPLLQKILQQSRI
jgi:hypothetical protein